MYRHGVDGVCQSSLSSLSLTHGQISISIFCGSTSIPRTYQILTVAHPLEVKQDSFTVMVFITAR